MVQTKAYVATLILGLAGSSLALGCGDDKQNSPGGQGGAAVGGQGGEAVGGQGGAAVGGQGGEAVGGQGGEAVGGQGGEAVGGQGGEVGGTYRAPVPGVDIDDEMARFLEQVALLWAGQDADFDGDGTAEVKVTSYDPNGDTKVEYWALMEPDAFFPSPVASWTVNRTTGMHQLVLDLHNAGVPESQTSETPTGRELLEDRADTGTFDWRRQEVFQADGSMAVTIAHLENGAFVTDSEYTTTRRRPKCGKPNPGGAETKNSGAGVECFHKMPTPPQNPASGGVTGAESGAGGYVDHGGFCSTAHLKRLFNALTCAKKRFDTCLSKWNAEEAARFAEAWNKQPLLLDCALKAEGVCNGMDAGTDSTTISFRGPVLNTPTEDPPGMSDESLCSSVFHELMHWAGTADDGILHGDAVDRVYACSRFCDPRCKYDTGVDPSCGTTPGSDCAVCVLGKSKQVCGYKEAWVDYGPAYTTDFCGKNGTSTDHADCSQALGPGRVYCDGSFEARGNFTPCCVSCPDGYNNGFACSQWYPDAAEGVVTFDAGCRTTCAD